MSQLRHRSLLPLHTYQVRLDGVLIDMELKIEEFILEPC